MNDRFTVTEIADLICRADGLTLSDHGRAHHQVTNAVRRGLLKDGETIDRRGTVAFPLLEVYRARIIKAFADLSIDMVFVRDALERAALSGSLSFDEAERPERMRTEGGWYSRGPLVDAIEGVAAGEAWELRLRLRAPGLGGGQSRVDARFVWLDRPEKTTDRVEALKGPVQAEVRLDLTNLFRGLPALA